MILKRCRKKFMRAVRRQISLNRHRRSMLKHYKIDSAMVLAMELRDLTVKETKADHVR